MGEINISPMPYFLIIDIGTTGLKVFLFDKNLKVKSKLSHTLAKTISQSGNVEQNPYEYIQVAIRLMREILKKNRNFA